MVDVGGGGFVVVVVVVGRHPHLLLLLLLRGTCSNSRIERGPGPTARAERGALQESLSSTLPLFT